MQKSLWLTLWGIAWAGVVAGQVKKQFTVENSPACEDIQLHLKANSGSCFIKPSQGSEILNVFSNQDQSAYAHDYRRETVGSTCVVYLQLRDSQSHGIGQTISTRMFNNAAPAESAKFWKMYLTNTKPYALELDYAVGNANVDLSGLAIRTLKINTGSADVSVGYYTLENQITMDTFDVRVDLGSLNVKNINLSKTRYMVADVGFGNMLLDFSNAPIVGNKIRGSVGAGNLVIILPSEDVPVRVRIADSWLCSVKLPESMKKIGDNVFASGSWTKDAENALDFDLDVSMGNIVFKQQPAGLK